MISSAHSLAASIWSLYPVSILSPPERIITDRRYLPMHGLLSFLTAEMSSDTLAICPS